MEQMELKVEEKVKEEEVDKLVKEPKLVTNEKIEAQHRCVACDFTAELTRELSPHVCHCSVGNNNVYDLNSQHSTCTWIFFPFYS